MKLPPIEKIYEVWSALADGRVKPLPEGNRWEVSSSDGAKTYTVAYDPTTDTWSSNDNATMWQGYPGYPILACMMLQGVLPYDSEIADQWKGINWNALNKQFKRDYAAAVAHVMDERHIDTSTATNSAENAYEELSELPATIRRLSMSRKTK